MNRPAIEKVGPKLARWEVYFRWQLRSQAHYLSAAFEKSDFEFYSTYLRGVKSPPPRWKECTQLIDQQLGEALGQVFVARTFTDETKQATLRMEANRI